MKVLIMAILLGICCVVTYYFHVILGAGIVFSHFFYIPIILAVLWWRKKGLVVAIFLMAWLIFSHFFIRPDVETVNDLIRAPMFIIIAFTVAYLSEKVAKVEERHIEMLEKAVDERTKELTDEKNYTRHLIESSPDFQMTLDKEGRIIDVNKTFEELIDMSREELIGTSIYEYLPKEETEKAIANIFEKGKVRNIELTMEILGKENIICNFSGTIFTTSEGKKRVYTTGRDITKHKQKVDELEKYKKVTVGRELRMAEMKKEADELLKKLGEEPRYHK